MAFESKYTGAEVESKLDNAVLTSQIGVDVQAYTKHNFTATSAPTVTDDTSVGYQVGSVWIDTSASPKEAYRCVDATAGAAVWVNTSLEIGELGTLANQDKNNVDITGGSVAVSTVQDASTSQKGVTQLDTDDGDSDYPQMASPASDAEAATPKGVTVLVRDRLRASVESATGGQCTVLYDDQDLPSYMRIIPAMTGDTLMSGMTTGLHPAFLKNTVKIPELFIGMFQAYVIGGRAYSLPYKNPTVNVDFDDARSYCTAKGTGWHMMTNWEWAAVALWCMKNGVEPRGNTNHGRAHDATYESGTRQDGDTYAPGDSAGVGNILCGTGPHSWRHDQTPAGISDLVGNVWEWIDGFKLVNGRIYMPADNEYDLAEASWPAMSHYFSDEAGALTLKNTAGTSTTDSLSVTWGNVAKETGYTESDLLNMALISPNGVIPQGRLYARTADERLPFRGGSRSDGGSAGLAALNLNAVRAFAASYFGFRLAFSNI